MNVFPFNQTHYFSRNALRAIDSDAIEKFGIPSIVLMENAAKGAANIILDSTESNGIEKISIMCGRGNNGGDGYAVARHLANAGGSVYIVQLGEPNSKDAITNASICEEMNIPSTAWTEKTDSNATLIIDAIFGTGLNRTVEGIYADAIHACNAQHAPCVALDIPSGLDCDTGKPLGCCVHATMTISFVGMKQGFLQEGAKKFLGKVVTTDIGCPMTLLHTYGSAIT